MTDVFYNCKNCNADIIHKDLLCAICFRYFTAFVHHKQYTYIGPVTILEFRRIENHLNNFFIGGFYIKWDNVNVLMYWDEWSERNNKGLNPTACQHNG